MDKRPKRRRHRDNQYYLKSYDNKKFTVEFKDSKKQYRVVEVSKELFSIFDRFELEDKKMMNEEENHFERFELSESILHTRLFNKGYLENIAMQNLENMEIMQSIQELTKIQQRRILLYFFYDLSMSEIARIEGCSNASVKESIDAGLKKLKKTITNPYEYKTRGRNNTLLNKIG